MRIYRYEHNRAACFHNFYGSSGDSLTGHGPAVTCLTGRTTPKFGSSGDTPQRIMQHERCAVTLEQFDAWKGYGFKAKTKDWDIVVYEVNDDAEGVDWREDNNQIIFNPAFASYVGTITYAEIKKARVAAQASMV